MNPGLHLKAALLVPIILELGSYSWSFANDFEVPQHLTVADLAGYRAALSGKVTDADAKVADPPAPVVFKDLWNRPDLFRGRRVMVRGQVVRIFRQGPVGSFPPLAEVWITSPSGDPFCVVFPQPGSTDEDERKRRTSALARGDHEQDIAADRGKDARPTQIPELGRTVRFTGTFLRMVRYATGNGARLAPLVVGDRLPVPSPIPTAADGTHSSAENAAAHLRALSGGQLGAGTERRTWAMGLTLAALLAGVLAFRHIRTPSRRAAVRHAGQRTTSTLAPDPPLEFIEPRDEP